MCDDNRTNINNDDNARSGITGDSSKIEVITEKKNLFGAGKQQKPTNECYPINRNERVTWKGRENKIVSSEYSSTPYKIYTITYRQRSGFDTRNECSRITVVRCVMLL